MKRAIVLAIVATVSQAMIAFAGPEVPSKAVIAPPPPPPASYFRPDEFDIGAFASWMDFTATHNVTNGSIHGWGGGMDFTFWFPWKYAGVRFQGAGFDISGHGNQRTETVVVPGFRPVTVTGGGGSFPIGEINADALLRLPLDDFWPGVHLAPYVFGGFGGLFAGNPGEGHSVNETFTVTNNATGETHVVTFTGRRINGLRNAIGTDRVLGRIGGGLEYRFTPHIGIFTEAAYVIPNGASNNFVQWNFIGVRYAF